MSYIKNRKDKLKVEPERDDISDTSSMLITVSESHRKNSDEFDKFFMENSTEATCCYKSISKSVGISLKN